MNLKTNIRVFQKTRIVSLGPSVFIKKNTECKTHREALLKSHFMKNLDSIIKLEIDIILLTQAQKPY